MVTTAKETRENPDGHLQPGLPGVAIAPFDPWVCRPNTARIRKTLGTQRNGSLVIYVTRLDGSQLVVNADLIETVEHTADTVITLLDGKKLVVKTLVDDVVERVIGYRQLIARG